MKPAIMDCPNSDFEDHVGGPPAIFVDDHKDGDVEYKVVCGCGFEGETKGSIEAAVEAWNKQ